MNCPRCHLFGGWREFSPRKLTAKAPWKMMVWKTTFLLKCSLFSGTCQFCGSSNVRRGFGGLWISCLMSKWLHWISTYVQLVCMCDCHSGSIQSDWMFSCFFCLPKWKQKLAGQVDAEYSKRAVLEEAWRWSKLLTGSPWAPERYGFLPVKIADSWKSFIHVPRLMSFAREKGGKIPTHSWFGQCSSAALPTNCGEGLRVALRIPKKMRNQGDACSCFLKVLLGLPLDLFVELGTMCLQDSPSCKCIHLPS